MIHLRHLHAMVQQCPWPKALPTGVLRRILSHDPDTVTSPFRLRVVSGQLRWTIRQVWPHIVVVLLFIGFSIHNQSIVLGDKSNHQATLRGALVLYFFAVDMFCTRGIHAMLRALVLRIQKYCCTGGMPSDIESRSGCRRTFSESHSSILAGRQSPLYLSHLAQILF
jgi:hypothetical protein